MTETAKSDDPHFLVWSNLPVPQRRIGRNAGAKQRCRRGKIKLRGNAKDEGLVDHNARGVTAKSRATQILVLTIVGVDRNREAILLVSCLTIGTAAAGIKHDADGNLVARLEFGDTSANLCDAADNLMTGHARINRVVPFIAPRVQVRMANTAEQYVDFDIHRLRLSSPNSEWGKR